MPETNQLRALLAERNVTVEVFAVQAGIAPRTLYRILSGRPSHRSTRILLANAFGLQVEQVFFAAPTYYGSNTDAQVPA